MQDNKPKPHELLIFVLFLLGCVLFAGLPVALGFLTPLALPVLGELKTGLWGWVPILTIGFTLVVMLSGEITDRIVLHSFKGAGKWGIETLQSLLTFAVLVLLFNLVMDTYTLALTSAAVAVVLYLLFAPLISKMYKKVPHGS